jgi:hypothetical protein
MSDPAAMNDEAARHQALQRLRRRRNLNNQFRLYVVVNVVLVLVWLGSDRGFFWPIYPVAFWGLSLLIQAWTAAHPDPGFSEAEIEQEMRRS